MTLQEVAARSQAAAWNLCWPPGSPVSVLQDGRSIQTTSAGPAEVVAGAAVIVVATVDELDAMQPLDLVRPVDPALVEARAWRGIM